MLQPVQKTHPTIKATSTMNTKKLCKIICILCLGLPVAFFLFAGNLSTEALTSLAIQVILCGVMMFAMMKMMGCNKPKSETDETNVDNEKHNNLS